jgi:hypothetical protein
VEENASKVEENDEDKADKESETKCGDQTEREEGELEEETTTEDVEDEKEEEKGKALYPWMFSMAELSKGRKMILPVEGVYYPGRIDDIHEPDL